METSESIATAETPKVTTSPTVGTDYSVAHSQSDTKEDTKDTADVTVNNTEMQIRPENSDDHPSEATEDSLPKSSSPLAPSSPSALSKASAAINPKNVISPNCDDDDLQDDVSSSHLHQPPRALSSNSLDTDNAITPVKSHNDNDNDNADKDEQEDSNRGVNLDCHSSTQDISVESTDDSGNSVRQQQQNTPTKSTLVDELSNDEHIAEDNEQEEQESKDIPEEETRESVQPEEKEMFYKEFEEHLKLKPFGDDDDDIEIVESELESLDRSSQLFEKCAKKEPVITITKEVTDIRPTTTNTVSSPSDQYPQNRYSAIQTPPKTPTELPPQTLQQSEQPEMSKDEVEDTTNPFGDFDSEEEEEPEVVEESRAKSPIKPVPPAKPSFLTQKSATPSQPVQYPKDYNPFGDEEEEEEEETNESLNPFGEFDSGEEEELQIASPPRPSPTPTPRTSLLLSPKPSSTASTLKASPQSLRKSPKKSRAPLPPGMVNKSESSLNTSTVEADKISLSDSRTPTPTPRRNKASNGAGPANGTSQESTNANSDSAKKKKAAPPIPSVKREAKNVSIEDIEKELDQIGDELPGLESKRIELEQFLLSTQKALEKEAENDEEYKKKKEEFIEVAKKKCKVSQRQKELMYKKREAQLEEQQMDIEFRLRTIMSKQEALKTEEDHISEAAILKELMEIVENRNDIIENMIRDENMEIQEYIRIIEKVLPEEAKALTPTALDGSKSDLKSTSTSKLLKKKTISTLTSLKLKKKKNKDKSAVDIKDMTAAGNSNGDSVDHPAGDGEDSKSQNSEKKKKSHFSLGRSTLKKFTSKTKVSTKENDGEAPAEKPV